MKNAKKLALLLLSLVLLVGVFAVWALAEETPTTATVVYPDGSEQAVTVGEAFEPKAFENGFYKGEGNTLYKDDSTEGWIFTVEGADAAMTDLTIPADAAGKKIIASGATKIYAHINAYLPEVTYYEWMGSGTTTADRVYVLSGEVYDPAGKNIATTKRVAGTYDIYFEDEASFRKFFSTSVSIELGGVTVDRQDLRAGGSTKYNVTIYEDMAAPAMSWNSNGIDRATNKMPASGSYAQGEGGVAYVYFDLNGHVMTASAQTSMSGMRLYLYSSKKGAHWYNTSTSDAFYTSDDNTLYLSTDVKGGGMNNDIKDNLTLHCRTLFGSLYGGGAYIYGGHYYQTSDSAGGGFVRISRRIKAMNSASFYVLPGESALYDPEANSENGVGNGKVTVTNCTFYGTDTSAILISKSAYNSKTGAYIGGAATVKFANCTFYGLTATKVGDGNGTISSAPTEGDTKNTFNNAITYNTVTWVDGSKDYYYAASLDAARAYVESLPKGKAEAAPYDIISGKELSHVYEPNTTITFNEETFSAVQTDTATATKVYFTLAITNGETVYYTNKSTAGADLKAYLVKMDAAGSTVTLYADISTAGFKTMGTGMHYLDLNGHELTITSEYVSNGKISWDAAATNHYVYSSQPGGVIDATVTPYFTRSDDDNKAYDGTKRYGSLYLGEKDKTDTSYGKNLTVYCQQVNTSLYGTSLSILGGTYVQSANSAATYFLLASRNGSDYGSQLQNVKNATFVLNKANTIPVHCQTSEVRTFTNCTFINTKGTVPAITTLTDTLATTTEADSYTLLKDVVFSGCSFYNVEPVFQLTYHRKHTNKKTSTVVVDKDFTFVATYPDSIFGADGVFSIDDLDVREDSAQYLARSTTSKQITVLDVTYTLDGALITDPATEALKITFEDLGAEYWAIGTTPAKQTNDFVVDVENGKYYTQAYFDCSGITELTDGKVTAAGVAENAAQIAYAREDVFAFTYLDTKTSILYAAGYKYDCGETAEGVFEKFYEVFSAPASAYTITMYKDMTINKAMGFGRHIAASDSRDYYASLEKGAITWDLNGTKVTVAADCTTIDLNAKNVTNGYLSLLVLEGGAAVNTTNVFTVKSSKAGAQIINNSSARLFGVAEGAKLSYLIQGENITVESVGPILYASNSANDYKHGVIEGGTYIYTGTAQPFSFSGNAEVIRNATVICTKNVSGMFGYDKYRKNIVTVENCVLIVPNNAPLFVGNSSNGSDSASCSFTVKDCRLIGVKPLAQIVNKGSSNTYTYDVTYSGTNYASTEANLLAMYGGTAPDGKVTAYTSAPANGEYYKVLGYYENVATNFVTINNSVLEISELWVVGSVYSAGGSLEGVNLVEISGVWYYRPNPTWAFTVDGNPVQDACAAANAGKTVEVIVGGETLALYFSITEAGVTKYYYGDRAENEAIFLAKLKSVGSNGFTAKLYADITTENAECITLGAYGVSNGKSYKFDMNGFEWTVRITQAEAPQQALNHYYGYYFFYSSVAGGKMTVLGARSVVLANDGSTTYFGGSTSSDRSIGQNFTLETNKLCDHSIYGGGIYILGGTYIQNSATTEDFFINMENGRLYDCDNATFILNNVKSLFFCAMFDFGGSSDKVYSNLSVVSASKINLFSGKKVGSTAFTVKDGSFYNVVVNLASKAVFDNCCFNLTSDVLLNTGYIAYTGTDVVKTIAGNTYTFGAAFLNADEVGIVDFGFGTVECWKVGIEMNRADIVIDEYFTYRYAPFTVAQGEQTASISLYAVAEDVLKMSLSLQSSIGIKLQIAEALANASITFGDQKLQLTDAVGGYFLFTRFIAPADAIAPIALAIEIGENVHTLPISVGAYAKEILASSEAEHVAAHKLTYAMVEYVRVMANDASFLSEVTAPAGYEAKTLVAAAPSNSGTLLTSLRFNLANTIAVEIEGAEGQQINLILPSGDSVTKAIEGGTIIFAGLYVNEFYGDMTIEAGSEVYTFSLANYLNALTEDADKAVVQALYNYAYYADLYVKAL